MLTLLPDWVNPTGSLIEYAPIAMSPPAGGFGAVQVTRRDRLVPQEVALDLGEFPGARTQIDTAAVGRHDRHTPRRARKGVRLQGCEPAYARGEALGIGARQSSDNKGRVDELVNQASIRARHGL